MKLVCYREGRADIHIGDVFYVPDNTEAFDNIHFAIATDEPNLSNKKAELSKLEAQVAEAAPEAPVAEEKE